MRWLAVVLVLLLPSTAVAEVGKARREYNRLWNHYVAQRLGVQGQPPPSMRFGKTQFSGGQTYPGPVGQRQIVLSNRTRKMLKGKPWRARGQNAAAHEMRHVYQPDELWNADGLSYREQPREEDAYEFARGVMRRVKKDHRRQMKQQMARRKMRP